MRNKLKSLLAKIKNNSFVSSVFKVGTGQLIAQCLSLISVPILSRIYSDTAYGDTALITSTASLLINISLLGLSSAVMNPESDDESKAVFTTATITNVLISTAFTLFYALFMHQKKLFDVSESYYAALVLMWLYTVTSSFSSLMSTYANRKGRYNLLFFNPIIGAVLQFAIAVPLGLLGFGFKGFMLTHICSSVGISIHLLRYDNPIKKDYSIHDFKAVVKKYKDYILFQYPSNFIGNFGIEYPTQFLGRVFTTQELGGYSLCCRVMAYPIRLIAAPIATVYFKTATEYHREGKNLADFTYKMILKILAVSVVPIIVFIFVSEPLFAFVLGEKWRSAGALASVLIIQYALQFCTSTTTYCLVAIGKQQINFLVTVVHLLLAIISCNVGYKVFGTMAATVFCYSLGNCIYNIYEMATIFFCLDKKYLARFLPLSAAYTILMYGVVFVHQTIL